MLPDHWTLPLHSKQIRQATSVIFLTTVTGSCPTPSAAIKDWGVERGRAAWSAPTNSIRNREQSPPCTFWQGTRGLVCNLWSCQYVLEPALLKQVLLFYLCRVKGVFWKAKEVIEKKSVLLKSVWNKICSWESPLWEQIGFKPCSINKGPRCMFLPSLGLFQDCLSNSVLSLKGKCSEKQNLAESPKRKTFSLPGKEMRNYKEFLSLHPSLREVCPLWKSHYHLLSGSTIQASVLPHNCCIPTVQVITNTILY